MAHSVSSTEREEALRFRHPRTGYLQARTDRGVVLGMRIGAAHDWWSRLHGLLGRRALEAGEGLWLAPCSGVHTLGMRFSLDLLFLDPFLRVVRSCREVPPNRWRLGGRRAASVLELPAGTLSWSGVEVGHQVIFLPAVGGPRGNGDE